MIFVTLAIGRSFAAFCSNKTVPVAASINSALEAVSVRTGAAVCSVVMSEAVSASASEVVFIKMLFSECAFTVYTRVEKHRDRDNNNPRKNLISNLLE